MGGQWIIFGPHGPNVALWIYLCVFWNLFPVDTLTGDHKHYLNRVFEYISPKEFV